LNDILADLEVFYPATPERILQILVELKRQAKSSESRTSKARKMIDVLTSDSKSDTLKSFLETMKMSNEKIMLTNAFVQDQVTTLATHFVGKPEYPRGKFS
jgi:hypothetical protein